MSHSSNQNTSRPQFIPHQHPNRRVPPSLQRQNAQEGILAHHYNDPIARYQELRRQFPPQRRAVGHDYVHVPPSSLEEVDIREGQHPSDTDGEAWVDLGGEGRSGARLESGSGGGPTASFIRDHREEVFEEPCAYTGRGTAELQRNHGQNDGQRYYIPLRDLRDNRFALPERHPRQQQQHVHAGRQPPARMENRDYLPGGSHHVVYQIPGSQQVRPSHSDQSATRRYMYELLRQRRRAMENEYSGPREGPRVTFSGNTSQRGRPRNPYNATVEDGDDEVDGEAISAAPEPTTGLATNPTATEGPIWFTGEISQLVEDARLRGIISPWAPSPSPPDSVKNASEVAQGPDSELANDADGRGIEANEERIFLHSLASLEQEYQDAYNDSGVGEGDAHSPPGEDQEHGELYDDAREVPIPENSHPDPSTSAPVQPRCSSCRCCYVMHHLRLRIRQLEAQEPARHSGRQDYEREMEDLIQWKYDQDVGDVDIEGNIGGPQTMHDAAQEAPQGDLSAAQYSPPQTAINETSPPEQHHSSSANPDPTHPSHVQAPHRSPPLTHTSRRPSFPPPSVGNRTTMRRLIAHAQTEGTCTPQDVERWLGAEYLLQAGEMDPRVALRLVQEDMEARSGSRIRIRREGDGRRGV